MNEEKRPAGVPEVRLIGDAGEKRRIARETLEALPDWFENVEAREEYILHSGEQVFFAAECGGETAGFLCLKETGRATVELAVMGVRPEWHRRGAGKALFEAARDHAARTGYAFMQVKTVKMGCYEDYDRTNRFYLAMGFRELEVFPTLWGKENLCQVYVMALPAPLPAPTAAEERNAAGIRIRRMAPEDYDGVWALWMRCKNMGFNDLDDSREGIEKYLKRNPSTCFLALDGKETAGVVLSGHDGRRGFIHHMAVDERYRRRGVASALLESALDALKAEGIHKVALLVFRYNEAGNAFWERMGFTAREDVVYRNRALTKLTRIDT